MEHTEDDNIRWQKLEEQLDQPSIDPEQSGLTGEERNVLLFFKRLRSRLRPLDADLHFPVEEGWNTLRERIETNDQQTGNSSLLVRLVRSKLAVAAVLFLMIGAAATWWLMSTHNNGHAGIVQHKDSTQRAILPASENVQLVLADGQKLTLGQRQSLTEKNGVSINASEGKIEYGQPATQLTGLIFNTLMVPRGKKAQVTLPDGTEVWLNAASSLRYPVAFNGTIREVILNGEAYFDVKQQSEKPFVVRSGEMDVQVLGTAFNVNAYEQTIFTTLEKGKVKVNSKNNSITLSPGEQSTCNSAGGVLKKGPVYTRSYTGWKDGELYLEDMSLSRITQQLGRSYDYEFEFADAGLKDIHFTVDMAVPDNLQAVLDHISSTTDGLRFTVSGRVVRVSR